MTSEERGLLIGLKLASTNQKRDQYGITALVSQTSFRGETRGGVPKCGLFFQAVKQLHQSNKETLSVEIELKSILVVIVMMINVHIAIVIKELFPYIDAITELFFLIKAITHKALR